MQLVIPMVKSDKICNIGGGETMDIGEGFSYMF